MTFKKIQGGITFKQVAWGEALKELETRFKKDRQWKWKRLEVEISSFSAFFISEFSQATRRINRAMGIEIFNPSPAPVPSSTTLHAIRLMGG